MSRKDTKVDLSNRFVSLTFVISPSAAQKSRLFLFMRMMRERLGYAARRIEYIIDGRGQSIRLT